MRYIYAITLILALSLLGNAGFAVERTRKTDDSTQTRSNRPYYTPDKESMDRRSDSQRDRKDYDDFVDRNNNGIDDRAEQKVDQQESTDNERQDSEESKEKSGDSEKSKEGEKRPSRGR